MCKWKVEGVGVLPKLNSQCDMGSDTYCTWSKTAHLNLCKVHVFQWIAFLDVKETEQFLNKLNISS